MFGRLFVRVMAAVFLLAGGNAQAAFHLWQINEAYSNASGTIQFIELRENANANSPIAWAVQDGQAIRPWGVLIECLVSIVCILV